MNIRGHNAKNTVVLYHENCLDGLSAAFFARKVFGKKAKYIPVNYNKPVPVEATLAKFVYVVDFCFPLPDMLKLADSTHARGGRLTVLDHHETQKQTMRALKKSSLYNGCAVYFNQKMSGAGLSYLYFIEEANDEEMKMSHNHFISAFYQSGGVKEKDLMYKMACMVQDRDLWKWQLDESRPFSFWYYQNKQEFKTLEALVEGRVSLFNATEKGRPVMEYHDSIVQKHVDSAKEITLMDNDGNMHKGLFCFCHDSRLVSDIGNVLSQKSKTFGAVVGFSRHNNEFIVGLRSNKRKRYGNFNCTKIALAYGGGGHHNASGCRFTPAQMQEATITGGAFGVLRQVKDIHGINTVSSTINLQISISLLCCLSCSTP